MATGVIVSDIHIGEYPYGWIDPEQGLNTRLLDILHSLDQSIDFAIEKKVDFYTIVGDIYRIKHPNSKIRKQFAPRIKRLLQNNIRVILLTGNHDMTTSSDGAHALSEMEELCDLIDGLEVYSQPTVIKIDDTELYILPFVNRGEEKILTVNEFNAYQIKKIKEFNKQTLISKAKSNTKNRLFFGHFGTDKSVIGNSFDLDMSSDENENKILLSSFEDGAWTKVYLGHIHKHQEFNKIARHVGSIARVDFAEQDEQKGFYYFKDGTDEFVHVNDREFKTFNLKLDDDFKDVLSKFQNKIEKLDLSKTIVRVKVDIKQTYFPEIRLEEYENYLKEYSWHFLGFDINLITEEQCDAQQITVVDAPDEALKKHIEKHIDRFTGIEEDALTIGMDLLKEVKISTN